MKLNNWYVITGAPNSGKTSVVKLLEREGYIVEYETARVYIDKEIEKGRIIKEIRRNELEFQKGILDLKVEIEKKLPEDKIIFFDRAIPDSEAYYKLCGLEGDKHLEEVVKKSSYKKIFLFDLLPYKKDYARTESEEDQKKIQELLEQTYKKLNIPVVNVPKMSSKEERLVFILNNL
ncbi:ATP-binding protein [bacterium]|nr:ATP-binding protein [bacterium]